MYVIFDMDGVLADTETVYQAGHMYAAKLYGIPEAKMRVAADLVTGITDEKEQELMASMFGHLPGVTSERLFNASRSYFRQELEAGRIGLMPGVKEILEFLKSINAATGLASSSHRGLIEKVLGRHNVLPYFDVIISGDMVTNGKPDPEIFLTCARELGIPAEEIPETIVIEDSFNGIRAAYAAGMRPVMVPDQLQPDEEIREKAEVVLPSLTDVAAWLSESM